MVYFNHKGKDDYYFFLANNSSNILLSETTQTSGRECTFLNLNF